MTATNPLDRVFLLEYLHLEVPDVRLAVVGADDFMLARPKFVDLSGTVSVTSLPLTENIVSVRGLEKDDPRKQLAINFPSNAAEGIFLAAANLLGPGPSLNSNATSKGCADISIVGKTGFRTAAIQGRKRFYPCLVRGEASLISRPIVMVADRSPSPSPGDLLTIGSRDV